MEFKLKSLSREAIPKALEKAERYRLLNEAQQAESICRDILRVDADNSQAIVMLLLALSDQFGEGMGDRTRRAQELVPKLADGYERAYYAGLICERRARATLQHNIPSSVAYEWFHDAMTRFEEAEKLRPSGNDDALLRWNACLRTIRDLHLEPRVEDDEVTLLE